jgi:hypothetical protein
LIADFYTVDTHIGGNVKGGIWVKEKIDSLSGFIANKFKQVVFADVIHAGHAFGIGPVTNNNPWISILKSFDFTKNYIVFDSMVEGYFPILHLEKLHDEIRINNYPAKKIIWITSNLNIEKNYNDWKFNSKFRDDESINIIGVFYFLYMLAESLYDDDIQKKKLSKKDKSLYQLNVSDPWIKNNINKKGKRDNLFLFLNNKDSYYRNKLFETIKSYDGLDVSIYSFIEKGIFLDEVDVDDLNQMLSWRTWGLENLNQYYENTYFETFCSCDKDEVDRRIFLCDKVVKPLVQGHPFVALMNPFTLKKLKEMGFETFTELFDESYDNEVDIKKRFNMVVKEIKRYIDMWNNDKDEVHNLFSQDIILEKKIHNQNWALQKNTIIDDFIHKFEIILER